MAACIVCHKPLTDPLSVQMKMGSVCRLNQKIADSKDLDLLTFNQRACYDYVVVDGVVCIVDNDRGRSVTNDVENVIQDLVADGINLDKHLIIYRDTMGVWDELLVNGRGRKRDRRWAFAGFSPIGERDREAAISKVNSKTRRAA